MYSEAGAHPGGSADVMGRQPGLPGARHRGGIVVGEYCLSNDLLLCFPSLFIVTRALGGGEA